MCVADDDTFECCVDGQPGYKEVPEDFEIEDEYFQRTECCILHVDDHDAYWTFYPKHSSLRLETYQLALEEFKL